jgi:hypothetical protein
MALPKRFVYILRSGRDTGRYYTGVTSNMRARLAAHNAGECTSIVNQGRSFIQSGHPWDALWASLASAMLVVGLNLLADGLNEEAERYR